MTGEPNAGRQPPADPRQTSADDGSFGLALLLVALAGWVDMIGLAQTGVFVSFMSGNTTDLAGSLVARHWAHAALIIAVITLFVAASAVGELIERRSDRLGPALTLLAEAVCLVAAAGLYPAFAASFCLVLAMGLQTTALHRAGGLSVGLTYVTGTLVQVGRSIAAGEGARAAAYAAVWASLACGGALGALALAWSRRGALVLAAALAVILALATTAQRVARRSHRN